MGTGYYGPTLDTVLQLRETGPILVNDNGECEYMSQIREIRFYYHCEGCDQEHSIPVHVLPGLLNDYTNTISSEFSDSCPVMDELIEFTEFEEV